MRCYVALLTALLWIPPLSAESKPNIIVIVGDDLGYGSLGCYGCKEIPTPHLDSLAKNGVKYTNGYVSCPVCSPTRAGLLTGRYQQRFGHEFNPGPPGAASAEFGLPLTETTLPQHLKKLGYATGMVGKWHLGYQPDFQPLKRGFDSFFGFLGGAHSYHDAQADGRNPILRGTERVAEKEYLTDAFTREAVAFIDRHQKQPFFLYLTYNAVHTPMHAAEKYLQRFAHIKERKRRNFAAMLAALDDGTGAILDKLRQLHLEEQTLIIFISDNGGPTAANTSSNGPLSGFKGGVLEGGIRVPFLMQWKGHLPAGKEYAQPGISLDLLPTALAAAGGPVPPEAQVDGVNLLPFLSGTKAGAPHERLYWRFGEQSAIRQGDWKLVRRGNQPPRLFNLAEDLGEKKDLAQQNPEKRQELEAAWQAWNSQLAQPRWRRQQRRE